MRGHKLVLQGTFLCLCLLVPALKGFTDQRIEKIRSLYAAAAKLECESGCVHFRHTIVMNTMMPAIGLQTTTITFFYTSLQVDPEEDPYELAFTLVKAKITYNIAASVYYTIEYLYDEKGNPVFYFWQEAKEEMSGEKRMYFSEGKLIRADMNYRDDDDKPVRYSRDKNFKQADRQQAGRALGRAADYKKLFDNLLSAQQWE